MGILFHSVICTFFYKLRERIRLLETELILTRNSHFSRSFLSRWLFLCSHYIRQTQLHIYPPDFAANSPVYLSHQRLCLSFTNMKCVSVRNNSILSIFREFDNYQARVTSQRQAKYPPTTQHSPCCLCNVYWPIRSNVGGDNTVCLKTRINSAILQ